MSDESHGDDLVREWFLARGWVPERINCYDEEGVEGWRWSHPDEVEEFEELGGWDEPPAVSDSMREYMDAHRG